MWQLSKYSINWFEDITGFFWSVTMLKKFLFMPRAFNLILVLSILILVGNANAEVLPKDKKEGRYFTDQPDVSNDYQIHFSYVLSLDNKDKEWDINGKMEEILKKVNDHMLEETAKHKLSNGIAQKYKYDYRADGKLDITFIRVDKKQSKIHKYRNNYIADFFWNQKMNNPKKIYYNFVAMSSVDGGEAGVGLGSTFINNKDTTETETRVNITLHELHHAQGGGFACVPGVSSRTAHNLNQGLKTQLGHGTKLGHPYLHKVENCPQLADSVYLTPTSKTPYDPYKITCLQDLGTYTHPKLVKLMKKKGRLGSFCKWKKFIPNFKSP